MAEIKINIKGILNSYLSELQKISDLTLSGMYIINNYHGPYYGEPDISFSFLPYSKERIPKESLPNEFTNHLIRSGVRDYLEIFYNYLCLIDGVCKMFKIKKQYVQLGTETSFDLVQRYWKFNSKDLKNKIECLETEYNFNIWFKEQIFSLNKMRNCLVHRLGFVSKKDVNKDDKLVLRYLSMIPFLINGQKETKIPFGTEYNGKELKDIIPKMIVKQVEKEKEFPINTIIILNNKDFFDIGNTLWVIGKLILIDLQNYGYQCGVIPHTLEKKMGIFNIKPHIRILKK